MKAKDAYKQATAVFKKIKKERLLRETVESDKQLQTVLSYIEKAVNDGQFEIVTDYVNTITQERLKALGYTVSENGYSYLISISWLRAK